MPEQVNDRPVFSLQEVAQSIQKTLSARYTSSFWVMAEMNKLNWYKQSGHCYPDLVEKQGGKVIAQLRAFMWRDDYNRINNRFLQVLKEPLKDGIKVLFLAKVSFDTVHGLSLWIQDIDPAYTLGDLEKEKQETIGQLQEEGLFRRNQSITLPLLPQRIAIISVESSKGYADFLKVIENNPWNYKFFHLLFPSILQGDKTVGSMLAQLRNIKKVKTHFDAVAIIRGGGGDVGLSCYNHITLTREIARFPLPVITGIGHATNETVAEMIAFHNAITPTKLAEFLVQQFHNFSFPVQEAQKKITYRSLQIVREAKAGFQAETKLFRSVVETMLTVNRNEIGSSMQLIQQQSRAILNTQRRQLTSAAAGLEKVSGVLVHTSKRAVREFAGRISMNSRFRVNQSRLNVSTITGKLQSQSQMTLKALGMELGSLEKNISNMRPENVLKRGYSITRINGRSVKNISDVKKDDRLETLVFNGKITSIVESTKENNDE